LNPKTVEIGDEDTPAPFANVKVIEVEETTLYDVAVAPPKLASTVNKLVKKLAPPRVSTLLSEERLAVKI